MIRRAEFSEETVPEYLTGDEFQAQLNVLCSAPDVLNYPAAAAFNDIQVSGSYPPTIGEWAKGSRTYFCFITRASEEPLVGSLAMAPIPLPEEEEAPASEGG